jgi:hypothetical protein
MRDAVAREKLQFHLRGADALDTYVHLSASHIQFLLLFIFRGVSRATVNRMNRVMYCVSQV